MKPISIAAIAPPIAPHIAGFIHAVFMTFSLPECVLVAGLTFASLVSLAVTCPGLVLDQLPQTPVYLAQNPWGGNEAECRPRALLELRFRTSLRDVDAPL